MFKKFDFVNELLLLQKDVAYLLAIWQEVKINKNSFKKSTIQSCPKIIITSIMSAMSALNRINKTKNNIFTSVFNL